MMSRSVYLFFSYWTCEKPLLQFFPSPVWFAYKFTSTVIGFDLGLLFLRFLFFETDQVVTWLGLLGTMWRCQVKYYCIIIVGDGIYIGRMA